MANNYGAFSESAYPKDNNVGAYQESRKVIFSATPKKRTKASDTGSMNPLYKPKASPGPISSAANVRENRLAGKATVPTDESYSRKNMGTRPVAESTKSGKKVIDRKSFRQKRGD